ncbi:uncharacterized protein LOC113341574 [Papaver somniferum]|uniref:uncharacterized protein LOC113341574 n=1 Tax=Papaver somniferum TaxID=3469 RepID=UPI000E7041B3|nr:uncharacterized protein LOC113341574 [Papaver somniferum]
MIATDGVDDFPWFFIWKPDIPPKINFLVWCAFHGNLNTLDMLQCKGMDVYSSCVLCGDSPESKNHLLLHCKIARKIWSALTPTENWSWVFPESMMALAHTWQNNHLSNSGKVVWGLIPAAIIWIIWTERNCRTFEEHHIFKTDEELCDSAKSLVLTWASAANKRVRLNFSNTLRNWEYVFY